ncbi:DinB family protein [bacterium]|nr:DinB family protein [bacterium]
MAAIDFVRQQMIVTRDYTHRLLRATPPDRWLEIPTGGVSNVAWQVGHIAIAAYRLGLSRIRDPQPTDDVLIPPRYLELYGKGTNPSSFPDQNESPAELCRVMDGVQAQVLRESEGWKDEDLKTECLLPHPIFSTKIDSLWWYSRHESIHAGQIGLIRRMLGYDPAW